MSATQIAIAWGVFVALGTVAVNSITGLVPVPPPITVESLRYDEGRMIEDHTVKSANPEVFLPKSMALRAAFDGQIIPDIAPVCSGKMDRTYLVGFFERVAPLSDWMNDPACTPENLMPGEYIPVAIYIDGAEQVFAQGEPFVIGERE